MFRIKIRRGKDRFLNNQGNGQHECTRHKIPFEKLPLALVMHQLWVLETTAKLFLTVCKRNMFAAFIGIFYMYYVVSECSDSLKMCEEIIPSSYEAHKPPCLDGSSNVVFVSLQVLDIGEIDEGKMDFLFHTFVNAAWNDTRLKLEQYAKTENPVYLHSGCMKHIWTPDIFYETVKHVENFQIVSHSTTIEVYPDGALRTSTRFLFKAGCQMHFENYPFDVQKCLFYIGLMQPDSVSILKWTHDARSPYTEIPPIEMVRQPKPLQFYLREPTVHTVTEEFGDRFYSSLIVNFTLVRRITGSIINTYAPSTLIVVMSWVTFWIKVDVVPARVALSVTSLLTLCTQVQQYKSELPPVNYVKAMDIWLFVCIFVVFSTLVEFALCYNLYTKICKECSMLKVDILKNLLTSKETLKCTSNVRTNAWISEDSGEKQDSVSLRKKISNASGKNNCAPCLIHQKNGQMVDDISKIAFPASFFTFAIIYWCYYLYN